MCVRINLAPARPAPSEGVFYGLYHFGTDASCWSVHCYV